MSEPEPSQQVRRTYLRHQGRDLICFAGCDYFRLSTHPRVLAAVRKSLTRDGLNVAASRRTTGNHPVYLEFEKQLARFFRSESALLVASGYVTNLIAAQALAGQFSHAVLDEHAHVSLADAAPWLHCPVLRFAHRDAQALAAALARCGPGARPVVLTDGMFSRDGGVAPLRAYSKLLPRDGLILVDDAHGAGTLGAHGRGSIEIEKVDRSRLLQCITLSKAFGAYGGAILGSARWRDRISENSRMWVGSTPAPPPWIQAAATSLQVLRQDPSLRRRLQQNANFVKAALRSAGLPLTAAPGPIVPLRLSTARQNAALRNALLAAGIYPSFVRYPGGPSKGCFRFVISSEHTPAQLRKLVRVLTPFAAHAQADLWD